MEQKKVRIVPSWIKAKCPYCNREYSYPEGLYRPSTCGNFECLQKHLHPKLKLHKAVSNMTYIRRQGEN